MKGLLTTKSPPLRFAFLASGIAFVMGIFLSTIYLAGEHLYFFISAPLATFPISYFIWKWTFVKKKHFTVGNVFAAVFLLTLAAHYWNFVLLGLARLFCYHFFDNCTAFSGRPDSLIDTFTYLTIFRTCISLYYWGIVSFTLFLLTGLYVHKTTNNI